MLIVGSCTTEIANDFIAEEREVNEYLHIPSPVWDDQIIYFIVTDRFMDGDTTNNDQGAGEFKKGDGRFWNGGDLKGITQKLDYISELGATAIWITPPVANQWVNPQKTGTGNHGYWASNFIEVDKHLGTLDDYKQLSATLHKNGMYLIQDVVCNHMGDFYTYMGPFNPIDVTKNFKVHDVPQPTQTPFNHNDARKMEDRELAVFHFAPSFHDHSDTIKKRNYQFADLDDLNTQNPLVRRVLRESYNFWIREIGVDGFRFDTPHFTEHEFWHDFIHSDDPEVPGVEKFAHTLGKKAFLTFGETALPSQPLSNSTTIEVARYLGSEDKPEMTSILNFPLANTIHNVFEGKKPTSYLTYRLVSLYKIFKQPNLLLNFIDNHDGPRFLAQTGINEFRQALLFIMTIPGIPVIYYGTEQELMGMRQTMFKGGAGSSDTDHFNIESEAFRFVQDLIRIRKQHDVFRKGELKILRDASTGPGVFIYQLKYQDTCALVMFNTSNSTRFVDKVPTNFKGSSIIESYYSISGEKSSITNDEMGNLSLLAPAHMGLILLSGYEEAGPIATHGHITINPQTNPVISSGQLHVTGHSEGVDQIRLALDGNLENSIKVFPLADGTWMAVVEMLHQLNGKHRLTAFSNKTDISDHLDFVLDQPVKPIAKYRDDKGDDNGPFGNYKYPSNPGYTSQMDILDVNVFRIGSNIKIDLTMDEISGIWLPPNGFDHVLINIYIDLPGSGGLDVLPLQNADMPLGAQWDYRIAAAGFLNKMYSKNEATRFHVGQAVRPTPFITVNDHNTIEFLISSESLGYPPDLEGTKLYINTWDGSATHPRVLDQEPDPWSFSGGNNDDPKIMDDTEIIELKGGS